MASSKQERTGKNLSTRGGYESQVHRLSTCTAHLCLHLRTWTAVTKRRAAKTLPKARQRGAAAFALTSVVWAPTPATMVEDVFLQANGLKHHALIWEGDGPTILLAHGYLDIAWSWKAVAEQLSAAGYRVVAWDWRGHGESEHIGKGGYYHFPDYALDLEVLLPQLRRADETVHLVGHSMGGTAVTLFAGARSQTLRSLTLVEGLGPPPHSYQRTPAKFRAWFETVGKYRTTSARPMSLQECVQRMRLQNPELSDELGLFLAEKATKPVDGGRAWRFDPLHRSTAPMPFRIEVFGAFLERIKVPTLVVAGERGFRLPDEQERANRIPNHQFVEIPNCGHMVHWFEPKALGTAIARHVRDHNKDTQEG